MEKDGSSSIIACVVKETENPSNITNNTTATTTIDNISSSSSSLYCHFKTSLQSSSSLLVGKLRYFFNLTFHVIFILLHPILPFDFIKPAIYKQQQSLATIIERSQRNNNNNSLVTITICCCS